MIPILVKDGTKQAKELLFQEQFDPALISALYKNFKDPIEAVLEIIDNAIDDRVPGKRMIVTVGKKRDRLSITNKGGIGMGPKELENFFIWGLSKKRGKLGRYGQGGKAAMGYLGKSWSIRSTKTEEDIEYVVEESDWDDRTSGLKEYIPKTQKTMFLEDGVVQIDIWNLKRNINNEKIRRVLGNIYSPLIESGEIEIILKGKIPPLKIPLDRSKEYFNFKLSNKQTIRGWLSFLEEGSSMKGGIKCYAFGRLITEKEFFGPRDPSFKASINRLIGEIYIDFEIPLLMNKTDFDRGSMEWQEIKDEMYKIMNPYIELLLEEKENNLPTEKEHKEVQNAGEIWREFLKYREHSQKEGKLPGLPIDFGQKQPEPATDQKDITLNGEIKVDKREREPYDPATPPPLNSIGKRRRTGSYPKPILHSLPEFVRYEVKEEGGEQVIIINNNFPVYQLRKPQISLYVWETLILEYAKAEEGDIQTIPEYIEEMNGYLLDLAKFLNKKKIKVAV